MLGILTSTFVAHFLFIKVGPMAEGGRAAEVYFSDRAEAGDPKFVGKIAGTALWAQTRPGVFTPLVVTKRVDRLRAAMPAGSAAVVGACEYGAIARPGQTPFLLRYYPKAVAGRPDVLNALAHADTKNVPLEIMATFEADRVRLVALRGGEVIKGAVFHTVDDDLTESEVAAGPDGAATWTPPSRGNYAVYVKDVRQERGEKNGVRYDEVREFATLALSWPLARRDADPEAVALFQKALATRATWDDFPGFSAGVDGSLDGRPFAGKVTVDADGSVTAEVDDPAARPWIEDQLGSAVMHRLPDPAPETPVVRFADDDEDHPLGRLLTFQGGRFASSYRVKGGQITVVNRHIGPQNMTITVLENRANAAGKFLPHAYEVHYWDADTGRLDRVETVQDGWARVGGFDLPAGHTVTTSSGAGLVVRRLQLTGHALAGGRGQN